MFDQYEKKTGIRLSEQKLPGILCLLWLIFYLAGLIWALRFYCSCDRRQNIGCVWPCAAHHFSDGSVDLWRRKRYGGAGENVRTHGMADLSAVDPSFIFGLQQVIQSGCWRYLMVESVKQEGGHQPAPDAEKRVWPVRPFLC